MWNRLRSPVGQYFVSKVTAEQGETDVLNASVGYRRADADNRLLFVCGRLEYVSYPPEFQPIEITAGMVSEDLPDYPAGMYTLRALEDTKFWCIQSNPPGRKLIASKLEALDGARYALPQGSLFIVASGEFVTGLGTEMQTDRVAVITTLGGQTVTARGPALGFSVRLA